MACNTSLSIQEQLRISESQLDQLDRENKILTQQLKEVIAMNTHWQRYDADRTSCVYKLNKTNRDLQRRIRDLEGVGVRTGDTNSQGEHLPHSRNQEVITRGSDSEAIVEIATLTDRMAKLMDRVVDLENGRHARKKEEDDQVALLRQQIDVCVEDFEAERKDRERIHGKIWS